MRKNSKFTNAIQTMPNKDKFVALDCEMVGVGDGGVESSLARVTIVDWFGTVLLDQYIKQTQEVTDYRTFVSGIKPEHLTKAFMTKEHCKESVLRILSSRILVGHALDNDLQALGITHPWWLIRDTAKFKPFLRERHCEKGDVIYMPRKLRDLAKEKLHRDIQVVGRPHNPHEDATAALDLYKSMQIHWEYLIMDEMDQNPDLIMQHEMENQMKLQIQHRQQQLRERVLARQRQFEAKQARAQQRAAAAAAVAAAGAAAQASQQPRVPPAAAAQAQQTATAAAATTTGYGNAPYLRQRQFQQQAAQYGQQNAAFLQSDISPYDALAMQAAYQQQQQMHQYAAGYNPSYQYSPPRNNNKKGGSPNRKKKYPSNGGGRPSRHTTGGYHQYGRTPVAYYHHQPNHYRQTSYVHVQ